MRAALVVLLALIAVGCSGTSDPVAEPTTTTSTPPPPPATLSALVFIQVAPKFVVPTASGCLTRGPYADISTDSFLTVTDADGKTAGADTLGEGFVDSTGTCTFHANIELKPGSDFYGLSVAGRDPITKSVDDIKTIGWALAYGTQQ